MGQFMAHTIVFDTFQQAQRLKDSGFTEIQIKAQIENSKEQVTAINGLINDNLATKQDIKETKQDIKETKQEIRETKQELEFKIASMGYKTIIATGLMITASVGVLNYLIKLH